MEDSPPVLISQTDDLRLYQGGNIQFADAATNVQRGMIGAGLPPVNQHSPTMSWVGLQQGVVVAERILTARQGVSRGESRCSEETINHSAICRCPQRYDTVLLQYDSILTLYALNSYIMPHVHVNSKPIWKCNHNRNHCKGPCPLTLPPDSIFHYNLLY